MKKALITGANGQDASFLAELLTNNGYQVYGTIRRNSVPESQTTRISELYSQNKINLIYADLLDSSSIDSAVISTQPDELYHLAAQSHVRISFDLPHYTTQTNCIGTLNILEAVRKFSPHTKIYNAASSEMFGNSCDDDGFQRETTPMHPVSPYGCSKLFAFNLCNNYKNAYGLFIASGILFNHESHRRGINFVTNKIAYEAVRVSKGLSKYIILGNLQAERDWGYAGDYVKAMHMMLQETDPNNYVVSTGISRSVESVLSCVLNYLNLDKKTVLKTDKKYERPEELHKLKGDSSIIREKLGWKNSTTFEQMMKEMVEYWYQKL